MTYLNAFKIYPVIVTLFFLVQGIVFAQSADELISSVRYLQIYSDLTSLAPDAAKGVAVSGLVLKRDVGRFELRRGTLHLCSPVGGRVVAAVFNGDGEFLYTPSSQMEREQLARIEGDTTMRSRFTSLLIIVADTTMLELRSLGWASLPVPEGLDGEVEEYVSFLHNDEAKYFDPEFVEAFINGDTNSFFFAAFRNKQDDPKFFQINPYEDEEIRYFRQDRRSIQQSTMQLINQFNTLAEAEYGVDPPGLFDRIAIERENIVSTITSGMDMNVAAEIEYIRGRFGPRWIPFNLFGVMRIDSIVWDNGKHAGFFQTGGPVLWLNDKVDRNNGDTVTATFYYHGRPFARMDDWILLESSIGWYPRHSGRQKSLFDLTFNSPEALKLVSIGNLVSTNLANDVRTTRWTFGAPIRNASFHIGVYDEQVFSGDSMATVHVLRSRGSSAGIAEQVGSDIRNSLRFYSNLYGPLPFSTYRATEIPSGHGEAFPGLIHLSGSTFERNNNSGFQEMFRAHEVGHQWWGIAVDFATYHDQWLSEAFAEYSSMMYMQIALKDNDLFFDQLGKHRKDVIGLGQGLFSERKIGPIWLGYRNNESGRQEDYSNIIYKKGAWVLHMLRNLMIDLNTMKEDRFIAMMQDFYSTYAGGIASTDNFQSTVERHLGGHSMSWFFNQWVRGTAIPKYIWAWTKMPTDKPGEWQLKLRVKVEGVPENFQMYVPITVDYGDGNVSRSRILLSGTTPVVAPMLLPKEPDDVTFNDFESVLCTVDEEGWD